jgi:hypothetical protein
MGKDRFSNQKRNNYEKSYRPYTPSVKCNLVFTRQQKVFIQNFLTTNRDELTNWERDFLLVLFNSATYSQRQKDTLEKIIKNK